MFQSARLKLTAWYLLIIMLISGLFSLAIYADINHEYNRIEQRQKLHQQQIGHFYNRQGSLVPSISQFDPEVISESRKRLQTVLLLVNFAILFIAGLAGYFLAGRTLRPIKQMVDEQNRFITDASHELRTPLTSLITSTEVNLRDKRLNLKNAKDLLASNLEQAYSLRTLSDDLLALTQNQTKNGNTNFENVNLERIVEEALKKVTPIANKAGIRILDKTKDYSFEADFKSLVNVLVIMLDNAVKYNPEKTSIEIASKVSGSSVVIIVKDQGIGINNEDLPYIFDRFYRADKSRSKDKISGYGLGLSIAKKIVDAHKGEINVKSEVGKGSEFIVQIPKVQSSIQSPIRL